jgi:hypothetical protein
MGRRAFVAAVALMRFGPKSRRMKWQTTAVIVPAPIPETCVVTSQTVTLRLPRAECPFTPEPVVITFNALDALDGVTVTAVSPTDRRQTLPCEVGTDLCQVNLPLEEPGEYRLTIDGLNDQGEMVVTDGMVAYTYAPYDLTLRHGQQVQSVRGEGARQVEIALSVSADEIGCPLPDLRATAVSASPDPHAGGDYPELSVSHQGNLLMTDLGATECQAQPVLTPVQYEATLPAGTKLAGVAMLYWLEGAWQAADCGVENGRYLCTAYFPNPLLRHPYAFKIVANDQESVGTSLPFDSLCLVFR